MISQEATQVLCQRFEHFDPVKLTCDMEVEAINKAFPEMQGRILSKLASEDCVCLFKYERDFNPQVV